MSKIRVLIVDDSVVVRNILSQVLSKDPDIDIAGVAANGKIALAKIPQVNPDIITLDIEMPEMNGLEALAEIRKGYPKLPVIMFSTLTERGAEATLDALTLGASDYVTKPANVGKISESIERLRTDLIPKIKALVPRTVYPSAPRQVGRTDKPAVPGAPPLRTGAPPRVDVVAIGVSTGGPNALGELIPALPEDFPVPILIVQHMPPVFTANLANRLDRDSAITVLEGSDGIVLQPGTAILAAGGVHMLVERQDGDVIITTNDDPPENSCRPAVDVMFRSVVELYRQHVLAVIMTGMGYDGHLGAVRVREAGGIVLAQDEETSVVWGMPGIVVESGLADSVLPLEGLGAAIEHRVLVRKAEIAVAGTQGVQS